MNPTTGNDPNDFNAYIHSVVQDVISKNPQAQTTQQAPAEPSPLELNINGQKFTYKDTRELETQLNSFIANTGRQMGELQQKVQEVSQAPTQQGAFVTGDEPVFDDKEFVKQMTESPQAGLKYAFNQFFFDGKSENPVDDIKSAISGMEQTKRTIAAYQFRENHKEFNGGSDAAQKIDTIRQELGLPYDLNGLEAAYLIGIQRNQLPNYFQIQAQQHAQALQAAQAAQQPSQGYNPYQQQTMDAGQQMNPASWNGGFGLTNNPYLQAPPAVSRNSGSNAPPPVDFESMSLDQLEQVINKLNNGR